MWGLERPRIAPPGHVVNTQFALARQKLTPASAIATGVGLLLFTALFKMTGILTYRSSFKSHAVTESEDPLRFKAMLVGAIVLAVGSIVWGLVKLTRR